MIRSIAAFSAMACAFATSAFAEPKDGSFEYEQHFVGTSTVHVAGPEHVQVNYEAIGTTRVTSGTGVGDIGSIVCVGAYLAIKGEYGNHSGICTIVYSKEDKAFVRYEGTGAFGKPSSSTWTYIGGEGKLEGLTGQGEGSGMGMTPPRDGVTITVGKGSGSFKLP